MERYILRAFLACLVWAFLFVSRCWEGNYEGGFRIVKIRVLDTRFLPNLILYGILKSGRVLTMAASQDIAKRDLSSMGGEKDAQNNAAEELRDVESDAESVDTKAGSIWTIMGSVSGASTKQ